MVATTLLFAAAVWPPAPPVSVQPPAPPKAPPTAADVEDANAAIRANGIAIRKPPTEFPYPLSIVTKPPPAPSAAEPATATPAVNIACRDVKFEFDPKTSRFTLHATGPLNITSNAFQATAAKLSYDGERLVLDGKVAITVRGPGHSPQSIQAERFEMQLASGKLPFRGGKMSFWIGLMR